jgi:murein DD-endopeptidase MepM/ murein hydrolase activator NlpD
VTRITAEHSPPSSLFTHPLDESDTTHFFVRLAPTTRLGMTLEPYLLELLADFMPLLARAVQRQVLVIALRCRAGFARAHTSLRAMAAARTVRPRRESDPAAAPRALAATAWAGSRVAMLRRRWDGIVVRAAAPYSAAAAPFKRIYETRPQQLAQYVFAANLALAAILVISIALALPRRTNRGTAQSDTHPDLPRVNAGGPALQIIAAALATPLPPGVPTATPILNFEPWVPTPTPTPIVYPVWEAVSPWEGGWTGSASCAGWYAAPIGSGYFVWPTDKHYLSGKNYSLRWHPGLDLAAYLGDPIYSVDSGVVVYAGWNTWGYGNMVVVDHGNGWHTLYAHFSEVSVYCGQPVTQGSVLGLAGSTGNSTGPHLHLEMRSNIYGRVNPWNYLP